jgi:hypothetical protein
MLKKATSVTKKTTCLSSLSVKTVFDERTKKDAREGFTTIRCPFYVIFAN